MPQQHRHINAPIYLKGCLTEFVFGLPVCPPVQKDTGTAFLIKSEKVNRFRKDHAGYFMWHLFPLPYLVVQGRNVKRGVP